MREMEIIGFKVDKSTLRKIEKQIQKVTIEMENCLDNIHETTCYELFRTDSELIWIKFIHDIDEYKIEIIREEQS